MTEAAAVLPPRPWWRQLIGFNLLTGILLGIGGWYVGWFGAHAISGASIGYYLDSDYNEISVYLAYLGSVVGFLVGLGFLNYPIARLRGYPPSLRRRRPAAGCATSASAPITRWSASSTSGASGSSSSSAA